MVVLKQQTRPVENPESNEKQFPSPEALAHRDIFESVMGRCATVLARMGLRYRLFRRHTQVRFMDIEVVLPHLPAALDGFRITLVADLHYSPFVVEADYDRLMERIAQCRADLFVFAGDNISFCQQRVAPIIEKLGRLSAPCGSYAVLGNHDYCKDANWTAQCYADNGITLLVNEWVTITHHGRQLALAGLDDMVLGSPDIETALYGLPDHLPVVLASHVPAVALDARCARAGLVLSGHVHAGQVCLPFVGPPFLPSHSNRSYLRGLYRTEHTQLYLSSGVGASGTWFRWRAQPEVPTIVLRSPASAKTA